MLHVRRFGEGPTLVALHGFTHTGAQFLGTARLVQRRIVAPDLPGHGLSAHIAATLDTAIEGVAEVMRPIAPVPVLGYSQGGRIALIAALWHPELVRSLILISSGAGIDDSGLRVERRAADRALADRLRGLALDDFLAEWMSTGVTAVDHHDSATREADLAVRRENSVEGLAAALEGYGQGAQPSVWDRLSEIRCPVLVVSGSRDARYGDVGDRLDAALPHAERVVIEGAGHNPLADRPHETAGAMSAFLDRNG